MYIKHYANSTARTADEGNIAAGITAQDDDTGNRYQRTTAGWVQTVSVGAAHVNVTNGLASKAAALAAATTYSATQILGLLVTNQGTAGNWTLVFTDGGSMTIPYTGLLTGTVYPFDLSSITSSTNGTAVLFIP